MRSEIRHNHYSTKRIISFFCCIFLIILLGCNAAKKDRLYVIDKLIGSQVKFGNKLLTLNGVNSSQLIDYDYQIVLYTDSAGCTDCAFDLDEWRDLMIQADSVVLKNINFKFIFHPSAKNELLSLIIKSNFKYPVFLDYDNSFSKENYIPEDVLLQCFLIDRDNKIVAAGNPVYSSEVWNYFVKIMNENS